MDNHAKMCLVSIFFLVSGFLLRFYHIRTLMLPGI